MLATSPSVLRGLEADERIRLDILPASEAAALLVAVIGPDRAAASRMRWRGSGSAGTCRWRPVTGTAGGSGPN